MGLTLGVADGPSPKCLRMAENQCGGVWTPTAENFAQHQLLHVSNFWKLGYPAVFHLKTQAGGKAELSLTFQLPSPSDPLPPPQYVPAFASPSPVRSRDGLKKVNQSRLRRRARRASDRAAAEIATAAEQGSAGNATAKNNVTAEKKAAVNATDEAAKKEIVEVTEKQVDEESAAEKVVTAAFANEAAEDAEQASDCVASTSTGSSGAMLTVAVPGSPALVPASIEVEDELPPLPLCLYCCHRGSGEHQVHYYGVCICSETDCSCACYCSDEQFELKTLHWPRGLGSRRAVGPEGRAKAMALAMSSQWISDAPCEQSDCCMRCSFDSPCTGGPACPSGLEMT